MLYRVDMRRRFMNISHINIDNYLTIEALEDGLTVSLSGNVFEYCIDGDGHWKKVIDAETESIDTGHMLSIRGEARYISQTLGVGTFKISKKCNLKGNCLSILFKDNAANNYSLESGKHSLARLFERCESIVEVSENFLPATTLTNSCYSSMFKGCTSLTTAPKLPATTLKDYCYSYMFYGCSKLNYIKMLATNISATNCLSSWVFGVASTGTFVKNPAMTTLPTATSSNNYAGIPSGWTVVNDGEQSGGKIENYLRKGKTSTTKQVVTLDFPAETNLEVYYTSNFGTSVHIFQKGNSTISIGLGPGESIVSVDRIEPNEDDVYIYKIDYK